MGISVTDSASASQVLLAQEDYEPGSHACSAGGLLEPVVQIADDSISGSGSTANPLAVNLDTVTGGGNNTLVLTPGEGLYVPPGGGNTSVVTPNIAAGTWVHDDGTGTTQTIASTATNPTNILVPGNNGGSYLGLSNVVCNDIQNIPAGPGGRLYVPNDTWDYEVTQIGNQNLTGQGVGAAIAGAVTTSFTNSHCLPVRVKGLVFSQLFAQTTAGPGKTNVLVGQSIRVNGALVFTYNGRVLGSYNLTSQPATTNLGIDVPFPSVTIDLGTIPAGGNVTLTSEYGQHANGFILPDQWFIESRQHEFMWGTP